MFVRLRGKPAQKPDALWAINEREKPDHSPFNCPVRRFEKEHQDDSISDIVLRDPTMFWKRWFEAVARSHGRFILNHRWLAIGFSAAVFCFCAYGVRWVAIDDDYRIYFPKDDPFLTSFEAHEAIYAEEDSISFTLAPRGGDVFTPEVLQAVEELTDAGWQIPFAVRVSSLSNFQHTYAVDDDIVVENLYEDAANLTAENLSRIRDIALSEPLLVDRVISQEGHATAVYVTVSLPDKADNEQARVINAGREFASKIRDEYPNIDVHILGTTAYAHAFTEMTQRDLATIVPLMYLLVFALIHAFLRSLTATIAAIVVVVMSMGTAVGLTGWLGIELTPPSSILPTIVMMVAVADSIHILVTMLWEMRHGGSKESALVESMRLNMNPVVVTSLTTAIGFLSMNISDIMPLRDLGNMAAVGVLAAFFYTMVFLPGALAVLPVRRPRELGRRSFSLARLAEFVIAHRKPVLWASAAIVISLVGFVPRNEFTNNFTHWFDETTTIRQSGNYVKKNLTGINSYEYSLPASRPGGITDPEYLTCLDEFCAWIERQDYVVHAASIAHIIKRLNRNMHGDDPAYYRIPDDPELAAQYLLLYEMSLPKGMDLTNEINLDKSATRLIILIEDVGFREQREIQAAAAKWLDENAPPYMKAEPTGATVLLGSMAASTIRSTVEGLPFALALITLVLMIAFRSVKFGLLSVIPNLVPIATAFGVWGIFVGKFNFGVACVASMSIGIVVDDTVHFISKYLRARRERKLEPADCVRYAFSSVGSAMVATTAVLLAGFLVLSTSSFLFNSYQGKLTAIVILLALVADLLLLPAVLVTADRSVARIDVEREDLHHDSSAAAIL